MESFRQLYTLCRCVNIYIKAERGSQVRVYLRMLRVAKTTQYRLNYIAFECNSIYK